MGESLVEVGQEIAVEAGLKGGYAGVTASVKAKFKRSEQRSEKTHFLMISFTHSGTRLYIEGGEEQIRAELIDEFRNALDTGDPDELIQEYGTHLVRKIIVGGRAEYYVRSSATSRMTSEEFDLAARAKYDSLGGVAGEDADAATGSIEASTKAGTKNTMKIKELEGNESIDTIGGTAVSAVGIKSSKDWNAWAASIAARPAFLGFEEDGLMPIWRLASDKARRTAIQQAYRRKAAKEFAPEILSMISDVRNHPDARVVVPEGYKLLCGGALDNWKGAGHLLTASYPESDNTWRASGKDHNHSDPASISVFALAVYDPDDIWEVKIFPSRPSPKANSPEQEAAVEPGYVMVGGGAWVDFTGDGNMLLASHPVAESKTTWHAQSKDHFNADPAKITAYAVGLKCRAEGVKLQSAIAIARSNRSLNPQAAAAPPAGYKMVGGGAAISFDGPGVLLTGSYPTENNQWEGRGKAHQQSSNGTMTAYCIGLKIEA
jgi:MAC/Perforin domain